MIKNLPKTQQGYPHAWGSGKLDIVRHSCKCIISRLMGIITMVILCYICGNNTNCTPAMFDTQSYPLHPNYTTILVQFTHHVWWWNHHFCWFMLATYIKSQDFRAYIAPKRFGVPSKMVAHEAPNCKEICTNARLGDQWKSEFTLAPSPF